MTLTKDYYWLVPDQTLIEAGVTVTVTEGRRCSSGQRSRVNPMLQTVANTYSQGRV